MQTDYLMQDFCSLFGGGSDITFSSGDQEDRFNWSLAEFHVDVSDGSTQVSAFGLLFRDDTERVVYKCFYAPYGDTGAMEYLLKNVCNFGPAGDAGGAPDPNDPVYADSAHELAGTWYVDGDYSGTYFVVDALGDWELYAHTVGDPEGNLVNHGYIKSNDSSQYFFCSDVDGSYFDMFCFDTTF